MNNVSVFPRKFSDSTGYVDDKMAKYFGGDRTLSEDKVVGLLVSTSFGANSILYAVWLGYLMGMWAMLIHIAWCLSFCLLSLFSKHIYAHTSIQDFLGSHFGKFVKKIAAVCSVVGLLYFSGWEIAIAKSGLYSFVTTGFIVTKPWILSLLLTLGIFAAILYTIIGGQKANGYVNNIINKIKLILLVIISIGVFYVLCCDGQFKISTLIPDFSCAVKNLGFAGLITNIFINLSWQFVDNSSWQIVSSGHESKEDSINYSLKKTGIWIFVVYTMETFLGALLRGISGLDSNNVLTGITNIVGSNVNVFFHLCTIMLILFSMVSLIDGMSLSVAQTIMVDLNFGKVINRLIPNKQSNLRTARIVTLILGITAAWGIQFLLAKCGSSIFDFVYVFTVVQLSLVGPVITGLVFCVQYVPKMWISIILSVIVGFFFNIYGNIYNISWFIDIAGTMTAMSSLVISIILCLICKKKYNSKI